MISCLITGGYRDDDDELLQLAIQQSLLDADPTEDVTLLEALGHSRGENQNTLRYHGFIFDSLF